jgi:hypothetical protein
MTVTENDDNIQIELTEVAPETARMWLEEHNNHNRRIRKSQVAALSRDLTEGRWLFTGDTVKFSKDGQLLDGQHLAGIASAEKPATMLIIRGIDPEAQAAMDLQTRRMAYDALKLRGSSGDMKNAAAVARGVIMYDENRVPTPIEVVEFVEAHEDELTEATEVAEMVRRSGRLTGGAFYGIAFYLLARVDRGAAHDFFEKLAGGYELEKGSPILLLSKHFTKGLPYGFGRGIWHLRQNLAFVFTAWNAWRQDKEMHQMRVPKVFPEPR